jgi:hypothetical protein
VTRRRTITRGGSSGLPPLQHPTIRQAALPWHQPKSPQDDATAADAVRAIVRHPSYREADQDVDFLTQNDTRGVRLQLDYLKAELLPNTALPTRLLCSAARASPNRGRRGAGPWRAQPSGMPIRTMQRAVAGWQ